MQKIQRLKKYVSWLRYEHIGNKSARETYDKISENANYDGIVDIDQRSRDLEKLIRDVPLANKIVLDVACGSGAFINAVIDKDPKDVVGVDISSGMLKLAKERFGKHKNVQFINKSFMEVNFGPSSFDLILLANASRYIPKGKERVFFSKVEKWLKKGGIFIIQSDFGNGFLGRLLAPVILSLSNKSNTNPNTTFEWNLEKELAKYFVIKNKRPIGGSLLGVGQNLVFVCEK